jgi:hypothetical protein
LRHVKLFTKAEEIRQKRDAYELTLGYLTVDRITTLETSQEVTNVMKRMWQLGARIIACAAAREAAEGTAMPAKVTEAIGRAEFTQVKSSVGALKTDRYIRNFYIPRGERTVHVSDTGYAGHPRWEFGAGFMRMRPLRGSDTRQVLSVKVVQPGPSLQGSDFEAVELMTATAAKRESSGAPLPPTLVMGETGCSVAERRGAMGWLGEMVTSFAHRETNAVISSETTRYLEMHRYLPATKDSTLLRVENGHDVPNIWGMGVRFSGYIPCEVEPLYDQLIPVTPFVATVHFGE